MTDTSVSPVPDAGPPDRRRRHDGLVAGVALVVVGCLLLMEKFVPEVSFEDYWPLILVAVGVAILFRRRSS